MRLDGGPIDAGSALDYLGVGGFAALGLITVLFFVVRRRDRTPLWLGLFYFALASHFLFRKHEPLANGLFPGLGAGAIGAFETAGTSLSLACLALFVQALHPRDTPRAVARAIVGLALGAALAAVVVPRSLQPALDLGVDVAMLACAAGLAFILAAVAWRNRNPWEGLLAGMPLFYPVILLDLLQGLPGVRVALTIFGVATFIVAPVVVLSLRIAHALRNQAKFTADLVEAVPVALALRDDEGRYLFVNRTWETWYGASREDVVGRRAIDRRPIDTVRHVLELDRAAFARGPGVSPDVNDIVFNGRRYTQSRSVMARADGSIFGVLVASIDTTERHAQEQQLRDQMALTRALIDENPNAMYLKDTGGRYLTVNDAWLKMVGKTREQAIGRNVLEIFGDEESKRYHAVDMELLARGEGASEVESLRTGPDGNPQWLIIRKAVLRRADGEVLGLVGVNTDITPLKRYEKELADRNKFITEVIEALPVSVVVRDTQLRHLQVNRAWERYYGVKREQIIGKRFIEFPGWREDPELAAFAQSAEALDRQTLARGPDSVLEAVERRRKGRVYLNTRRALVDTQGHAVGVVGVSLDVTDQKVLEEILAVQRRELAAQKAILETTLENMDQGITMIDKDLRAIAANRRFLELLDLPADLFVAGKFTLEQALRYNALRGEYGPGDPEEQVRTRLELARKFEAHSFERKRPNGTVISVRGRPLPDGNGFVTTYTDVTEQKRAEEELKASVRLREEVERMSRHDLKTPIASVIAVSRMLRENSRLAPEDAQLLATVERAGYRILNMVNLSLDLFRMEQGIYQFRPQPVDLDEVAAKVCTDLQGQAASKNVQVVVKRKGRVVAHAEELLCYSIFANLLKNAIEAAPEGTTVTLTLEQDDERAVAHIHNFGTVPEEVRARFFQKYATSGKGAGLGLGAYSAQLLARVQGGKVTLNSAPAEGTTLTVRLQAGNASEVEARREEALAQAPSPMPSLPPLKVLMADDDEFNRLVLQRYLPTPPLKVTVAVNGRAAVDSAKREWPDVALLDLEMPVMDGYEAAKQLREMEKKGHRKRILIVAISSNDEEVIVKRALAAGCDRYLVKPAPREVLWQILAGATVPLVSGGAPAAEALASDDVLLDPDLEAALAGFLTSRREGLEEMRRALEAADRVAFKRVAHRLAGSFALYGFKWAAAQCKMLERESERDAGDLSARLAAVRTHLDTVRIHVIPRDSVTQ
jgi:PAS domain S-box-containing protein